MKDGSGLPTKEAGQVVHTGGMLSFCWQSKGHEHPGCSACLARGMLQIDLLVVAVTNRHCTPAAQLLQGYRGACGCRHILHMQCAIQVHPGCPPWTSCNGCHWSSKVTAIAAV